MSRRRRVRNSGVSRAFVGAMLMVAVAAPSALGANPKTKIQSPDWAGGPAGEHSVAPDVANGGKTVFYSSANDIVIPDGNNSHDVFFRNKGKTKRVSVKKNGAEADDDSRLPKVTPDSAWVTFQTRSMNLIGSQSDDTQIALIRRRDGKIFHVSKRRGGAEGGANSFDPDLTPNGRFVVFETDAQNLAPGTKNGKTHVVRWDRTTKKLKLVSRRNRAGVAGNGGSGDAVVSANGRWVAFDSNASNLVKNDNNGEFDVFVKDMKTGKVERVSVRSKGSAGKREAKNGGSFDPAISADGRFVTFSSSATNLVNNDTNGNSDIFVYDRKTDKIRRLSVKRSGGEVFADSFEPDISANGRWVTFTAQSDDLLGADSNEHDDIYLSDRKAKKRKNRLKLMSVSSSGQQGTEHSSESAISPDGRWVVFTSEAPFATLDFNEKRDIYRRGPLR